MQIRIMGTKNACQHLITDIKRLEVLGWEVTNVSPFYPNRGDTIEGRVYVNIE